METYRQDSRIGLGFDLTRQHNLQPDACNLGLFKNNSQQQELPALIPKHDTR